MLRKKPALLIMISWTALLASCSNGQPGPSEADKLRSRVAVLEGQLERAQGTATELERDLKDSQDKLDVAQRAKGSLDTRLAKRNREVESLRTQLENADLGLQWNVPTSFTIQDLDDNTWNRVRTEFENRTWPMQKLTDQENTRSFVIGATSIPQMQDLKKVQEAITNVSKTNSVPIQMTSASLNFQSVKVSAATRITVSGSATPGAEVWIDVGQTREVDVGSDGRWTTEVSGEEGARIKKEQNGNAYVLVRNNAVCRYQQIAIPSGTSQDVGWDSLPDAVQSRFNASADRNTKCAR